VSSGDGLHDGQPQAEAFLVAGAVGSMSLEGLQEPVYPRRRHHRPAVDHREERFDELFLLGARGEDPFMGCPEGLGGGVRVGEGDLAEDPLPGQRGAQLM
jgi:hypothetical protein